MNDLLDRWRKYKSLGDEVEQSYTVASRHYESPPMWLVAGQLLYKKALETSKVDRLLLLFMDGYLRTKFPSFKEYCMDPEEERAKDTLMEGIDKLLGEDA